MVRNYKPKPKPYNEATLRLALKEVHDGMNGKKRKMEDEFEDSDSTSVSTF